MPFDPEKLKQAQGRAQASTPMTSQQASSTFSAEKLKAAQEGGLNMDRESAIRQGLKQAALPTALGLAGGAAGTLAGPLAPAAVPFLSGIGSGLGEAINQRVGITAPDLKQIALQTAVPMALGTAGNFLRPARALFPAGTKGSEFLNRQAAPEMEMRLSRLGGPDPAPLFQRVAQSGQGIDISPARQAALDAIADMSKGSSGKELYKNTIGVLDRFQQKLASRNGRLTPDEVQAELRDLGAAKRTAEGKTVNEVERGKIDQVFGSVAKALDDDGSLMSRDLLEARRLVKRQAVLDEIEESVGNADKILKGQGANTQFNAAAVLRDLKKNPFWNGTKGERNPAFTPAEKQDIEELLTLLNEIPGLKPGAGQNAGSFQIARALKGGMITGGGATAATGGDPVISGLATAAGAMAPTVGEFARVLNLALRTESGRSELRNLLRQPGTTMSTIVNAFTHAAPAATAKPGPGMPMSMMPVPFNLEQ